MPENLYLISIFAFRKKMKKTLALFLCLTVIFSCKKEKKSEPQPQPEIIKTGKVIVNVVTYDSLGNLENDYSGVKVTLANTSFSTNTNSNGRAVFNNVLYGDVIPVLLKYNHDGPPLSFKLNNDSLNLSLPFPQYSPYKVVALSGDLTDETVITISFSLNKALIGGKPCKIAVLSSSTSSITNAFFGSADTLTIFNQSIPALNIAQLPNFKAAIASLQKGSSFKICVTSLSYGMIYSNVTGKQTLLGDNLFYPQNLTFTKTW